jgi:hypothetical protein
MGGDAGIAVGVVVRSGRGGPGFSRASSRGAPCGSRPSARTSGGLPAPVARRRSAGRSPATSSSDSGAERGGTTVTPPRADSAESRPRAARMVQPVAEPQRSARLRRPASNVSADRRIAGFPAAGVSARSRAATSDAGCKGQRAIARAIGHQQRRRLPRPRGAGPAPAGAGLTLRPVGRGGPAGIHDDQQAAPARCLLGQRLPDRTGKARISAAIASTRSNSSHQGVCRATGCASCNPASSRVPGKRTSFGVGGMARRISQITGSATSAGQQSRASESQGGQASASALQYRPEPQERLRGRAAVSWVPKCQPAFSAARPSNSRRSASRAR